MPFPFTLTRYNFINLDLFVALYLHGKTNFNSFIKNTMKMSIRYLLHKPRV